MDRPRHRAISNDWPACRSKRTASASHSARPVDSLAWPGENLTVRPVASRELGMSRNTAKDYRRLDFVPAAAAQEGARRTRGLAEGTPAASSRQCRCDPPPDLPGCYVSAWGALYTIAVCLRTRQYSSYRPGPCRVEQLKAALKAGLLAAPRRCAQKNSTRYALARFACSHRALFPLLVLAGVLVLFDVRPPIFFWKAGRVGLLIYKFRVKSAV